MATPESHEERVLRLEAKLAGMPDPDISSWGELDRAEQTRAARHFGFAQPAFRTSIKLRFSGDGVSGHDLRSSTAGVVIGGVTEVVDAAGQEKKVAKDATQLYLSPVVAPGSTILELFGPPMPKAQQEKLDTDIDDTPTDIALQRVFSLLDTVNLSSLTDLSEADLNVSATLANKLFALSNDLIDSGVDLGLEWTRPRGTSRTAIFSRTTAGGFRTLLDFEHTEREPRTEVGTLTFISTDGAIGFSYGDKGRNRLTIDASEKPPEELRKLWATTVTLSWVEETTSHPRRRVKPKVVRSFVSVEAAASFARPAGRLNPPLG
jgi:hypothetical protein